MTSELALQIAYIFGVIEQHRLCHAALHQSIFRCLFPNKTETAQRPLLLRALSIPITVHIGDIVPLFRRVFSFAFESDRILHRCSACQL